MNHAHTLSLQRYLLTTFSSKTFSFHMCRIFVSLYSSKVNGVIPQGPLHSRALKGLKQRADEGRIRTPGTVTNIT